MRTVEGDEWWSGAVVTHCSVYQHLFFFCGGGGINTGTQSMAECQHLQIRLKGHYVVFGERFNIYSINEVITQTQKCFNFLPHLNKQVNLRGVWSERGGRVRHKVTQHERALSFKVSLTKTVCLFSLFGHKNYVSLPVKIYTPKTTYCTFNNAFISSGISQHIDSRQAISNR